MDRLIFFAIIFLLLCHISTCLWILSSTINSKEGASAADKRFDGTWLADFDKTDSSGGDFYIVSLYWTITTITTVGYGDISATNLFEMVFSSVMMLIGVISFSFANGALASIITNNDSNTGRYQEKLEILEKAKKDYPIPEVLYRKMKKSLSYTLKNEIN